MTSSNEVDPILSGKPVEVLTGLVKNASASDSTRSYYNQQVSEHYFQLKVLPQHICSPNVKGAVSCFNKETWQDMRQAYFDGLHPEILVWFNEDWADVPDDTSLGFAKIDGGEKTEDRLECNKANHGSICKQSTDEIFNGQRRYVRFLKLELNKLKKECAKKQIPLEQALADDANYVLAHAEITSERQGEKVTESIADNVANTSASKAALKHNVQVKNAVDVLSKLMTRAVGNPGGSETDDDGGLLFNEELDVSSEQMAANEKVRDVLIEFNAVMKDEAISAEQVKLLGNHISS